ncbi:MAG: histidine phosphatase family protein [Melioribacteraceae bacterium]|jgi:phosphohistidine phosphatase|nr:histidine phosphatase family protein [Melioribacteraceae bacterium]
MKHLYLIRHAKSSWEDQNLSDHDRPLSDRGRRDAPTIGDVLKSKKIKPDIVISSTARRAFKTSKIFSEILEYPIENIVLDSIIYEATTQNLLNIINKIDDKHEVALIFGHNPGFTVLANLLGDKYIDNMPTCAVVEIELNVNSWKDVESDDGKLISFEYPKKYDF